MTVYYLTHQGDYPRSLNRVGASGSWRSWATLKKTWQDRIGAMIDQAEIPRETGLFVKTTAIITVPDRRRRDAGNFGAVIEKALGDAMVQCRIIPDDTPEWWQWTSLTFQHQPGRKATTVILELVDEFEMAPCCEHAENDRSCQACMDATDARVRAFDTFGPQKPAVEITQDNEDGDGASFGEWAA